MTLTINSKTTKAQLEAELVRVQKEHEAFKSQVAEAALNAKEENDWCDEGFREAMTDLGLGHILPSDERVVTLEIKVKNDGAYDLSYMGESNWVQLAIDKVKTYQFGRTDLHDFKVDEV